MVTNLIIRILKLFGLVVYSKISFFKEPNCQKNVNFGVH